MSESIPRNLCSGVRQRMERAESGESVTGAGGSVPMLGVRHERKRRLGDAGVVSVLKMQARHHRRNDGRPTQLWLGTLRDGAGPIENNFVGEQRSPFLSCRIIGFAAAHQFKMAIGDLNQATPAKMPDDLGQTHEI
jgi:hypothetical protein